MMCLNHTFDHSSYSFHNKITYPWERGIVKYHRKHAWHFPYSSCIVDTHSMHCGLIMHWVFFIFCTISFCLLISKVDKLHEIEEHLKKNLKFTSVKWHLIRPEDSDLTTDTQCQRTSFFRPIICENVNWKGHSRSADIPSIN